MNVRISAKNLKDNTIVQTIPFEIPNMTWRSFSAMQRDNPVDLLDYWIAPYVKNHIIPITYREIHSWCLCEIMDDDDATKVVYSEEGDFNPLGDFNPV